MLEGAESAALGDSDNSCSPVISDRRTDRRTDVSQTWTVGLQCRDIVISTQAWKSSKCTLFTSIYAASLSKLLNAASEPRFVAKTSSLVGVDS